MKRLLVAVMIVFFLAGAAFAKVNVNTASVSELETVKGIGQKRAEAIIKYREQNGNFSSINELVRVKGIGNKLLEKISDDIEL